MKYLAVVNRKFSDNPSGSARVAWDIACLVRDAGNEVCVLCHSTALSDEQSKKTLEDGITIIRVGLMRGQFFHRRRYVRSIGIALATHLEDYSPDLIHIHSLSIGEATIASLGADKTYVATVHSPVIPETRLNWEIQGLLGRAKIALGGLFLLGRLQDRVLRSCKRIHVLSDYTLKELVRYSRSLPATFVIPHWRRNDLVRRHTKAEARLELSWPDGDRILFSLRRMVPRMGHETAIRAIAPLLEKYNARLVLAGDGPLRETLQVLASTLPGGDRVFFPGRISDQSMRLMYSGADLFVLPTAALECFGLIIIEALSYGCPVLGTNVGAIPEALDSVLPGFLVDPNDVDQLRERVDAILSYRLIPPEASEISAYVESRYGKDKIGPEILSFLAGS